MCEDDLEELLGPEFEITLALIALADRIGESAGNIVGGARAQGMELDPRTATVALAYDVASGLEDDGEGGPATLLVRLLATPELLDTAVETARDCST